MLKLIGVILTVGSTSLTGFLWSNCFITRCTLLKSWISILELLKTAIGYQMEILPEIFEQIALTTNEPQVTPAFKKLAQRTKYDLENGITYIWNEFLEVPEFRALQPQDFRALKELGVFLGSTEREDQIQKINICQEQLKYNLTQAEAERQKQVRVYRYLGFALGALLVLWFI